MNKEEKEKLLEILTDIEAFIKVAGVMYSRDSNGLKVFDEEIKRVKAAMRIVNNIKEVQRCQEKRKE